MLSTVGERIKMLRIERNMTQEELGEILGITKAAIQKYENGIIRNFKSDTIKNLCEVFHMPPAYFIFDRVPDLSTDQTKELLVMHFGKWLITFLENLDGLNAKGKVKLVEYCNDLRKIEEYKVKRESPC